MPKTALIIGATGLTGSHCQQMLLDSSDYGKVISLVRRPSKISHPKLEEHIVIFDAPDSFSHLVKADEVYCCMGTTIRKAGSQAAFKKVDYQYPLEIAKMALENEANQYLLVSSIGADADSRIFYSRTKGEIENAIKNLAYRSVHILQPSFLLGNRKEFRIGEKVGIAMGNALSFLMIGRLRKYRGIEARVVARAMLLLAAKELSGNHIWESDKIQELYNQSNQ